MSFLSKFLPKRKPPEIKNNIPNEKKTIRTGVTVYCNRRHGTEDGKLCPKCTAMLAAVLSKISRCPYGITKPICDKCPNPCFGEAVTKEFLAAMEDSGARMYLKHPILAIKHKLAAWGAEYAQFKKDKTADDKAKAKAKRAEAKKAKAEKGGGKGKKGKK